MNINKKLVLHNKFEVKVVDAKTGELKQEAVAYNVITDLFFTARMRTEPNPSTKMKLNSIAVGTGTGTPSITDTALFQVLFHRDCKDVDAVYAYPTSYITKQVVVNADEYNGSTISEVGLEFAYSSGYFGGTSYGLATHAMLQDSEGNQIAIEKTDVDVIYINATFYVTFAPSGFGEKGIFAEPSSNVLVKWIINGEINIALAASRFDWEYSSDLTVDNHIYKGYTFTDGTGNYETLTWDLPVMLLQDSEFNGHMVKTIGIPGIGAYNFPDPSVFPDYPVDHLVVGEGDGATTEFNIKCPLIKSGTVRVFVGGRELNADEFEADCESNCIDSRDNYYTAQMTCKMENVKFGDLLRRGPSSSWYCDPLFWGLFPHDKQLYYSSCTVRETDPIWLDLGEPKPCNSLRMDTRTISETYLPHMTIECSDDNENWTPVEYAMTKEQINNSYTSYKWTWPLTSARYWRVYVKGYSWTYSLENNNNVGTRDNIPASQARGTFFLGKSVPGLKLKTPPAAGETVEVSYKLNIPFKTENNLIRLTCSLVLQRG